MTDHACPFCGAKLDVAAVPPGKPFRCGGCDVALDAGETRLTLDEALGYRSRQRVRYFALCCLVGMVAAMAAYLTRSRAYSALEVTALVGAAAISGAGLSHVLLIVFSRSRGLVPVAPVAGKVEA